MIIGGGLSGLSAALEVERFGGCVTLIERSDALGGRVRTDHVDGFLLDRGFQVLLDSYPELKRFRVTRSLELRAFSSGALCHTEEASYRVVNPLRHPIEFMRGITSTPVVTYLDFLKLGQLLIKKEAPSISTAALVKQIGISQRTQQRFLQPFFGGVFLDPKLEARSKIFVDNLKLFVRGSATLPKGGMQALPEAISRQLKKTEILMSKEVAEVGEGSVVLKDGEKLQADAVILAVENPSLANWLEPQFEVPSRPVKCFYFKVPRGQIAPSSWLHLSSEGPVANLCVLNHIQPSYAPKGFDLISATVIDPKWHQDPNLAQSVQEDVAKRLSIAMSQIQLIKAYDIQHALPSQKKAPPLEGDTRIQGLETVFLAGECVNTPSINGALLSGRKAAKAALKIR